MKKRILSFVLLLACVTVLAAAVAFNGFAADTVTMADLASGDATVQSGDTVTIASADDLDLLAKYVADGGATEGIIFLQTGNIAMKSGSATNRSTMREIGTADHPFKGTYDGAGYTISNVQFTNRDDNSVVGKKTGLNTYRAPFAYIEDAEVKDLTILLGTKTSTPGTQSYLGGIVAKAVNSTISGCSVATDTANTTIAEGGRVMGIATGVGHVGGIVGHADNTVIDGCTVYVVVKGAGRVGGIVGLAENGSVISDCRMAGTVDTMGTNAGKCLGYGGIVGELKGSAVENCYAGGTVKGFINVGGVVGMVASDAVVENCFSDAKAEGSNGNASVIGAIAGLNEGTVKYAYASASVRENILKNIVLFGANNGIEEHVYLYDAVKNTDDSYDFVIGELVFHKGVVPCSLINSVCPAENCEACENTREVACTACGGNGFDGACSTCSGTGKVMCITCTHQICSSTGLVQADCYEFVAFDADTSITIGDVENITELDVALNAWITELHADSADAYVEWVVAGNKIINCTHTDFTYKAYEGKAPNCTETGVGDKHCALCDKLIEENVIVPATGHKWDPKGPTCIAAQKCLTCGVDNPEVPATGVHVVPDGTPACKEGVICATKGCDFVLSPTVKHSRPADAPVCATVTCTVCGGTAKSDVAHTPTDAYTCKDTTCSVCTETIVATTDHVLADGAFLCHDNKCTACGDTVSASVSHTRPEGVAACKEGVECTVCGETIATGAQHSAGMAPGCERNQICTACGKELQPALGHSYAGEQNCYEGITCRVCGTTKTEVIDGVTVTYGPLGNDYCVANRDGATCTIGVYCSVCGRRMVKPLGHALGDEATCGKGQSCTVCHIMIENATGEHTLDWANAKEVKAATDVAGAIVEVTCTSCARVFERYLPGDATDADGIVSIEGVGATNVITVDTLKVSDFATNAVATNNKLIQAMKITVTAGGVAVTPDGKVKVSLALNNTALKLSAGDIKLFNLDTGAEITGFTVDGGFVTFETDAYGNFGVATSADVYADNFPDEDSGLPIGAIIGIVAGAVVLVTVVVVVIVVLSRKKKGGASVDDGAGASDDEGNAE